MYSNTLRGLKFSEIKSVISDLVGEKNVVDGIKTAPIDPTLTLFIKPVKPSIIVKPTDVDDVLNIIEIANRNSIPLTPKSSPIIFRGDSFPLQGGIIIDFANMNEILDIQSGILEGMFARVEPGVTFKQLQDELKKHQAFVSTPARAPANVSVVSSYLNREVLYTNYKHGSTVDDIILTMEVAMATGRLLYTGSWALHYTGHDGTYPHTHGLDIGQYITGSLGTLGMVTKMNIKIRDLPPEEKVIFIESSNLKDLLKACYEIARATTIEIGNVHLIMNKFSLASFLAKDMGEFESIINNLSEWTYIIRMTGEQEWVDCQEADVKDLIAPLGFEPKDSIAVQNVSSTLLQEFNYPEGIARALNFNPFARVSFYSPSFKIEELTKKALSLAKKNGYKGDIGQCIIPTEQGRSYYVEYEFYFNPTSNEEKEMMRNVVKSVYLNIYDNGGFISVPREPFLRDHIYTKIRPYYDTISKMKRILDPNGIFHPGKIFSVR